MHLKLLLILVTLFLSVKFVQGQTVSEKDIYQGKKEYSGMLFTKGSQQLRLTFLSAKVVRLQYVKDSNFKSNGTNICLAREQMKVRFTFTSQENDYSLKTDQLSIKINKSTGSVTYLRRNGTVILAESPLNPRSSEKIAVEKVGFDENKNKVEKTANGDLVMAQIASRSVIGTAWKIIVRFQWQKGEALYGLGSHEEGYMNLRGKIQYLYQHNLKKSVPVLMSSAGYGLLFDVGSTMVFSDQSADKRIQLDAVNQLDYYFMYGPELDNVVGHYRDLTGKVQLPPKYAFGYIQSKERYSSSSEIDSVVTRFRLNKIPLDVVVQDWNYWTNGLWGYKKFDKKFYPDPKLMIQKIHDKQAKFMLSIWPNVAGNEVAEMGAKQYVLGRSVYDAFNPLARKMYWNDYVNRNLFSQGVDAWWCDSSEPLDGDWNEKANNIAQNPKARYLLNAEGLNELLGPLRANLFSLNHAKGIYENQRLASSEKRVLNLTRSGFAGIHRYGTFVWNGDTKATWSDFAKWIPSGLNYMATGNPYWTIDAGAFFVKSKSQWFWKGDFDKGTLDLGYREFYVRTLQFATWLPMMRSHGTDFAREPWKFGDVNDPFYKSIIGQINLRYQLLPYIYSVAAMVSNENYTMTRPLIFDFRKDVSVYDIKDQFMFGPSFMICPVTSAMYFDPDNIQVNRLKNRTVYLPKDQNWYDFHTGKIFKGGQTITANAPIDKIPVFVKEGSIVPLGAAQQYTSQLPSAPIEIRVYPGKDASFTIYQDEGDNYNYEKGKSSAVTFSWNENTKNFTIGSRKGSFATMLYHQVFHINIAGGENGGGNAKSLILKKNIRYSGQRVSIKLEYK